MRFLADENVSRLVIERLRADGFQVISITETRSGALDSDDLDAADSEGCILITEDRDFGELVIRQRLGVPGMILLELDRVSNAAEADLVAEVISAHTDKAFRQSRRDRARPDPYPTSPAVMRGKFASDTPPLAHHAI
jgi:predicted nuclease of predicted toxin-antitoxin system